MEEQCKRSLTITGKVEGITYASRETGYVVLRMRPKRGPAFKATGHVSELLNQAGIEGIELQLTGEWKLTKYGRQFAFSAYNILGSELLFFLSKVVKGLGARLSQDLVKRFGEEGLVRILDHEPEKLLEVKGIKEKRLSIILRSWRKHRSLKELSEYLGREGGPVTPNLIIRIYNYFGEDAQTIIQSNPYRLTEVRGIGFKTADRIALYLGMRADSPERIRAAIVHLLLSASEEAGHCYLPEDELIKMAQDALSSDETNLSKSFLKKIIGSMVLDATLIKGENEEVGLSSYYFMETWLKGFFLDRSEAGKRKAISQDYTESFIEEYEEISGLELSAEQKEIIRRVATEPRSVFALAGYAGTGKTTVCRAILELLRRYLAKRDEIVCCAFTGMASARIRKATGYNAFTIHSLLKYKGEGEFEHGPENPLPQKVVVLDEASMVSLPLFYRLTRALRPDSLFILVGDPAQLPPIGAGNVFSDILEKALVPAVHLTRIYRQSEDSVLTLFANEIRQGRVPEGAEKPGWKDFSLEIMERHRIFLLRHKMTERELKGLKEENNQAILDRISELATRYKGKLTHPVWDFQVLSPMRVGQLGTEVMNGMLQDILNPAKDKTSVTRHGITLREGDKVVHLQNKDMEVMAWDEFVRSNRNFKPTEVRRIFNGNVGLVTNIDREGEQFFVVYPERVVVSYYFDFIGDIVELAYALTVHKAQGSQYRVVAIPLSNSHFIMLNNKWFYTAITRAEEKVYIIAQPYAFKRACTNVEGVKRLTWLGSLRKR